jgi:hypothetical protein
MGNFVNCWVLNTRILLMRVDIGCDLAVVRNCVEASDQGGMLPLHSIDADLYKIDFKHLLENLAFSSQQIDPVDVSKWLVNFRIYTWKFSA